MRSSRQTPQCNMSSFTMKEYQCPNRMVRHPDIECDFITRLDSRLFTPLSTLDPTRLSTLNPTLDSTRLSTPLSTLDSQPDSRLSTQLSTQPDSRLSTLNPTFDTTPDFITRLSTPLFTVHVRATADIPEAVHNTRIIGPTIAAEHHRAPTSTGEHRRTPTNIGEDHRTQVNTSEHHRAPTSTDEHRRTREKH
jgi:hypothetical protein